ncbi:MAG TPA: hypothetical protein VLR29_05700, partial [Flavobacterium sp.]|nr:hypothetical protein [Flavobacterium sp.]
TIIQDLTKSIFRNLNYNETLTHFVDKFNVPAIAAKCKGTNNIMLDFEPLSVDFGTSRQKSDCRRTLSCCNK